MLQKRVAEIALINVDRIPTDRAGFGSTLDVIEGNGEKMIFQLVMPEDADAAKGMISTTSPIGRALIEQGAWRHGQGRHAGRHARVRDRQADRPFTTKRRMIDRRRRGDASPAHEPYSPQRRTALVLTGTGTAGAYHAGVLRALHEAGVKLDIVAGRGVGVDRRVVRRGRRRAAAVGRQGVLAGGRRRAALPVAPGAASHRLGARRLAGASSPCRLRPWRSG